MKQTITIKMYPDRNGGKIDWEIEAEMIGGYAIHRSLEFPTDAHAYAVTHIRSGLGCGAFYSKESAREFIRILQQIEIGGVKLADMPACEALACWPAIYREYIRLIGQEFNEERYEVSLNVAHGIADILACATTT